MTEKVKVAYNACFGGFSLSHDAHLRYAELAGLTLYPEPCMPGSDLMVYWTEPPNPDDPSDDDRNDLCGRELSRTDPLLIQVIEEMGSNANGEFAKIEIEEVAKGDRYRIDEYDGRERVMTPDDYVWEVAQ